MLKVSCLAVFLASSFSVFASDSWFDRPDPGSMRPTSVSSYALKRVHYPEIGSTQTEAKRIVSAAENGDLKPFREVFRQDAILSSEIYALTATQQTQGVGQDGRVWASPAGNVYATFILPWPAEQDTLVDKFATQVSALSVCQVLQSFGFSPQLKWRNDILLGNRKASGVLVEPSSSGVIPVEGGHDGKQFKGVIIGVGVNVNMDAATAAEIYTRSTDEFKVPPTSMFINRGSSFKIEEVMEKLKTHLVENLRTLIDQKELGSTLLSLMKPITAYNGLLVDYFNQQTKEKFTGLFLGLDKDGSAMFRVDGKTDIEFRQTGRVRPSATLSFS